MIKTIGDLRELIKESGGTLEIGLLTIRYDDGKDIDFLYKGNLMQWISQTREDDVELESYIASGIDAAVIETVAKEKIVEVEKVIETNMPDPKQSGMIEAYEKILLGHKITLEN